MRSRLAVVTGASRGIGRALTERLTASGQAVAAIGRSAAHLDDVAGETGAVPFVLDVADPVAVEGVFVRILSELGVPDLLVNNAAVSGGSGRTWELPQQDWWQVFEINVRGTYLCTRAVLPPMMARGSGRIINLSSGAATFPVGLDNDGTLTSAYMASKAAVNRFTEAVAGECFSAGVRAFSMSPGMVDRHDRRRFRRPVGRCAYVDADREVPRPHHGPRCRDVGRPLRPLLQGRGR